MLASTPERSRAAAQRLGAEQAYDERRGARRRRRRSTSSTSARRTTCTRISRSARWTPASTSSARSRSPSTSTGAAAPGRRSPRTLPLCAAVPFVYRYYPTVREARDRIASGESGAVHLIHGTYLQDWLLSAEDDNWRVDAGARRRVARVRRHRLALVRPRRVRHRPPRHPPERAHDDRRARARCAARTARRSRAATATARAAPVTTEDAVVLQFETDGGALGSAVISQISAGRKNRLWLEVDAAEEALAFDQEDAESLWVGRRDAVGDRPPRSRGAVAAGGAPRRAARRPSAGLPGLLQPLRRRRLRGDRDRRRARRAAGLRRRPARRAHHRRRARPRPREERWVDVAAVEVRA